MWRKDRRLKTIKKQKYNNKLEKYKTEPNKINLKKFFKQEIKNFNMENKHSLHKVSGNNQKEKKIIREFFFN